jgi:hypothetical protein
MDTLSNSRKVTVTTKQAVDHAMTHCQHNIVCWDEHIMQQQAAIKELDTIIT